MSDDNDQRRRECAGEAHPPWSIKTAHEIDPETETYTPLGGICFCGLYEWTATRRKEPIMNRYGEKVGRCIVCGADRNQPCDTISEPGTPRPEPHFYRSRIGENEPSEGFVPVRDER